MTEILILHGHLPIEYLDRVETEPAADESVVRELMARGAITSSQLARARAAQAGIPFVELTDYPVDRTAVTLIPGAICRRHTVLPIGTADGMIIVAMADPGNVFAIDDVRAASRLNVAPAVAEEADLRAAIDRYIRADDELSDLTSTLEEEKAASEEASVAESTDDDAPIVRFVNLLVSQAIQDHASDIHIEPAEHDVRVRYRIDGVLHAMQSAPKSIQNGVISRLKIMSDIDIAERRKPQDGRMSVVHGGRQIDLRVATLPTVWGEKVVMRILDNTNTGMTLKDLNLLERNFETYREAYSKPYGMILVTGPTGSGKSTTLYAAVQLINTPDKNVITIEDPVEYQLQGITQVQVNPKAGLDFATGLRATLRSDPDVILVGEIRDEETAQIAIEAAMTGHLVLSTLHTNDAASTITRLIEMGVEPFLVASAVDSIVAQRLCRVLCISCKRPTTIPGEVLHEHGFLAAADMEGYEPVGCARCAGTGYKSRVGLYEVLNVTEGIRSLALRRATPGEIAMFASAEGMTTLREDGLEKVRAGVTSIDEVIRVTGTV